MGISKHVGSATGTARNAMSAIVPTLDAEDARAAGTQHGRRARQYTLQRQALAAVQSV